MHSTSHSRVHTGPEGWLLTERSVPETIKASALSTAPASQEKEQEKMKYWFCVLPDDPSLHRLVLLAHARWVIEQLYEDAKQECGLDHDQGRSWQGLHRHVALVMVAYSFLTLSRLILPLPSDEAFPPSVTRRSLPSVHRQVLLWLFQDLILWLLHTQQIDAFCPRRNEQSSKGPPLPSHQASAPFVLRLMLHDLFQTAQQ